MTKPFSADWMDERGTERGRWLTRRELEVQLRVCAIYAQRARELDPSTKPTAWIACGDAASEAMVIEGMLVA